MEKEKGLSKKRSKLDEEILENMDLVENMKLYEMMKDLKLQMPGGNTAASKESQEKKK